MAEEIGKLVETTLRELGKQYFAHVTQRLQSQMALYERLVPPEERERRQKAYEAEQARLAAIEAAKTPAQRLREKQDACRHEFGRSTDHRYRKCTACGLKLPTIAAKMFEDGFEKGKDAGREECCE